MPEPHVVTVTGPLPASGLGVVDAHEHLFLRSPALAGQELDDPDRAIEEVRDGRASGIGAIVELTPIGLGRRPDLLRRVSDATGVPIIAATGYHRDVHYPPGHWVHDASVETLTQRIVADLEDGMHPGDWLDPSAPPDPARAGVIKGGASYHHITRTERPRLEAIALGGVRTGAAVVVHTEIGTAGHELVDLLVGTGLTVDRIVLAHLDRNPDTELHAEIAARGVTLVYDTIGRTKYHPDSTILDLVQSLVGAGHGDRILVGLDLGGRDLFRSHDGGPGLRYLMRTFVPRLRQRIGDAAVDRILIANPARAFAQAPIGSASR